MNALVVSPQTVGTQWSDRVAQILELCRGRRVLHLGCADAPFTELKIGNGRLLHAKLCNVASECVGVDACAPAIEIMRVHGFKDVMAGSIEDLVQTGQIGDRRFDIILAAEILEHVSNAGSFLGSIVSLMRRSAGVRLLATVPNAYCAYRFMYTVLTGKEGGNPDHVAHYSPKALALLLSHCGLVIEEMRFYSGREYLRNKGRERILYWIDRVAYRLRPQLGDGLIVKCRLA